MSNDPSLRHLKRLIIELLILAFVCGAIAAVLSLMSCKPKPSVKHVIPLPPGPPTNQIRPITWHTKSMIKAVAPTQDLIFSLYWPTNVTSMMWFHVLGSSDGINWSLVASNLDGWTNTLWVHKIGNMGLYHCYATTNKL